MKNLFFAFAFLFVVSTVKAQIPGSKIKGPVTIMNHQFMEGDTLHIGTGTNPNGDFKFIYVPINAILGTPQTNLGKMYANTRVTIKHFKEYENRKIGKKLFTVINVGGLNEIVEVEQAIEAGELIVEGVDNPNKVLSPAANSSVADEITKLKKLLDSGAITEDEYKSAKAKLLGL